MGAGTNDGGGEQWLGVAEDQCAGRGMGGGAFGKGGVESRPGWFTNLEVVNSHDAEKR